MRNECFYQRLFFGVILQISFGLESLPWVQLSLRLSIFHRSLKSPESDHLLLPLLFRIELAGVHVDAHGGLLFEGTVGLDLRVGGKGDQRDRPAILQGTIREGGRAVVEVHSPLLFSPGLQFEDLSEAQSGGGGSFLFLPFLSLAFVNDLFQVELADDRVLWMLGIREEGTQVFALLRPAEHSQDSIGYNLQKRSPEISDLPADLSCPLLHLQLSQRCRTEPEVLELSIQLQLTHIQEGHLPHLQLLATSHRSLAHQCLRQTNHQCHQFPKDKPWGTAIDGLQEIRQSGMRLQELIVAPLSQVLLQGLEAVGRVEFLVEREAALGVADPFLGLGLEEDFEDVDHAAGVEDGAVLGEEFAGDGGKALFGVLAGTAASFGLCGSVTHYTIINTHSQHQQNYQHKWEGFNQ